MSTCDRLFVLWSEPGKGTRHVIGGLWREADGRFCFAYSDDLSSPVAAGFRLLPEFDEHKTKSDPYRAAYLFSTFAQRIPSPKRADRAEMMTAWGVDNPDDQLEVLARSGGVQMTDNLELAEYRDLDDDLMRPLYFRVAGEKYYPGGDRLAAGARVELRREKTNEHDPCATAVLVLDGTEIGYIPRQYSQMVARLLDTGVSLHGTSVRRLILPEERGRWVIKLEREAAPARSPHR